MAKYERQLRGDFGVILDDLERAVMSGSVSASKEEESNFYGEDYKCAVRVFERYSYTGGNRVSLNITLLEVKQKIHISAITSGGSQAMFFKINRFGEQSFLDTIRQVIGKYEQSADNVGF